MPSYLINTCMNCGKDKKQTTSSAGKYCSNTCQFDYQFQQRFIDWYINSVKTPNSLLRKFLTVLHGYCCSVCGISEWNGLNIVLEVEHIDGNSENSSVSNVCLICPNCHSQTDTYKGKNRGSGRHTRMVRYHGGQSY